MVIKDAQIKPNDYYLKCCIFVVFLLYPNEKLTQTSHLQVVWGNFSKTACRWFLLEMLSEAVDIINCTSLGSRENPVIKAGIFMVYYLFHLSYKVSVKVFKRCFADQTFFIHSDYLGKKS